MKPIYRIFSRVILANIVAITSSISFCFFSFVIIQNNINGLKDLQSILISMMVFLMFTIYFLNITFFPIIKIDDSGINAYSMFWRRKLNWDEIKSVEFLLREKYGTWKKVEKSKESIKQLENGEKIFIFISKQEIETPVLGTYKNSFSHNQIASKGAIAFSYEKIAWKIIKSKLMI